MFVRTAPMRRRPSPTAIRQEIDELEREKTDLVDERKVLWARIFALEEESRVAGRMPVSPCILSQLEREHREQQQLVDAQERELEMLRMSDEAARRKEMEEEIKILALDTRRLEALRIDQRRAFTELDARYRDLVTRDTPASADQQKQKIRGYHEKLERYQRANDRLLAKIRSMRANRVLATQGGQEQVRARAEKLRTEIELVRQETAKIQIKINEITKRHKTQMVELRRLRSSHDGSDDMES
jgi:hypothetical protein